MIEELKKEAFKNLDSFFSSNKFERENEKILKKAKEILEEIWSPNKRYDHFVFEESLKGEDINHYFAFQVEVSDDDHYSYCNFFYTEKVTEGKFIYRLLANNNCDTGCCPTQEIFKLIEKFKD